MLPAFMALRARCTARRTASAGTASSARRRASCAARRRCSRRAVRLHRHDLRVPQVPAGMGHAADASSTTSLLGLRLGLHARRGARGAGRAARSSRSFAAAALALHPRRRSSARVASLVRNARLRAEVDAADRDRHQAPAIVQKSQGFMGGSFNTREFFHGAIDGVRCARSSGCSSSASSRAGCAARPRDSPRRRRRCCALAFVVQYAGPARRALVLLRAGQPPAEPLLPAHLVKALLLCSTTRESFTALDGSDGNIRNY